MFEPDYPLGECRTERQFKLVLSLGQEEMQSAAKDWCQTRNRIQCYFSAAGWVDSNRLVLSLSQEEMQSAAKVGRQTRNRIPYYFSAAD